MNAWEVNSGEIYGVGIVAPNELSTSPQEENSQENATFDTIFLPSVSSSFTASGRLVSVVKELVRRAE